jgi:hypothetical protein
MFFVHPQHGAMNASESEAAELEKQGWKASTREEWFRMNGKGHLLQQAEEQPKKRGPGRPRKESQ